MLNLNDDIRITKLIKNNQFVQDANNQRRPLAGDIATVEQVYQGDVCGYRLHCYDHQGNTIWRLAFSEEEIEYELI